MNWQALLEQPEGGSHFAQVYRDEGFLADAACRYIREGLQRRESVVAICTSGHWQPFARKLGQEAVELDAALGEGDLRVLDAQRLLAFLTQDDALHWELFRQVIRGPIERGLRAHRHVRVFEEMVDILWRVGKLQAAARLEEFWNSLAQELEFSLFCAYSMDNLDRRAYGGPLECICRAHSHLIPARDVGLFEQAVSEAGTQVLGRPLCTMMRTLAGRHRPATEMPLGQAALLWLNQNMPLTADKVLAGVRERIEAAESAQQA